MVETREKTISVAMLNKDKIYVDPSSEHKMLWFQRALNEGKIFVLSKTAMKKNMGFACEKDVVTQMYLFREAAVEYAKNKGIELDIFEKYEDDAFSYEAQLVMSKKTTNIQI